MKAYTFAPIAAREYPTLKLLEHPYIWGGVQFCVNLSEKPYSSEYQRAMTKQGIEWVHCPISEDPGSEWIEALSIALPKMYRAYRDGKKQIVHCDCGNNRSRTFVEALYYAINGKQYEDTYKGEVNHLVYNCKEGHLPDVADLERRIRSMIGLFPKWSLLSEEEMRRRLLISTEGSSKAR